MPIFLIALLTLVLSFSQSGRPLETPPNAQEEVFVRGADVSEMATEEQNESNEPDVSKATADNTAAEIQLPKPIPQVAVESSSKLEESSGLLSLPNESSAAGVAQASDEDVESTGPTVGWASAGVLNRDLRELPVAKPAEPGQVAVERTQGILP